MLCAAAYMGKKMLKKQEESGTQSIHLTTMRCEAAKDKKNKSSDLSQYPKLYFKLLFSILWVYEVFNIFLFLPALYNQILNLH